MKITFVKKIKADGNPCKKCADVEQRLIANGQMHFIDNVVIADERDKESPGMQIAKRHGMELAPFFLLERDDGEIEIYTIYFKFVKEVLQERRIPTQKVA